MARSKLGRVGEQLQPRDSSSADESPRGDAWQGQTRGEVTASFHPLRRDGFPWRGRREVSSTTSAQLWVSPRRLWS